MLGGSLRKCLEIAIPPPLQLRHRDSLVPTMRQALEFAAGKQPQHRGVTQICFRSEFASGKERRVGDSIGRGWVWHAPSKVHAPGKRNQ